MTPVGADANHQPSNSPSFQVRTMMVTAPEPKAATSDAGGGDLAGHLEAGLVGVADGAGQGVDGAVGQLGDAGPGRRRAPAGTSPTG